MSCSMDAVKVLGQGVAKGQRVFCSPQPWAQKFHPLYSWWVWNAGYVQLSCQGKSFSLQGINFMRKVSQGSPFILYINLDDGFISASSIRGETPGLTMSLLVTNHIELLLPGLTANEWWARLSDLFIDSFIQWMREMKVKEKVNPSLHAVFSILERTGSGMRTMHQSTSVNQTCKIPGGWVQTETASVSVPEGLWC